MTKDVLISISGLQTMEDEPGTPVEVITSGTYYNKNGKHYVLYDEVQEGFAGVTKNRIKIGDNTLDIQKKGVSNVHMVFEKDKKNLTCYNTPFGNLMLGIDAKDFQITEDEKRISVNIRYDLEINSEHLADCSIDMNICAKEAGNFSLQTL